MRLPMIIEDMFDTWEKPNRERNSKPNMSSRIPSPTHWAREPGQRRAPQAQQRETKALVARYIGYTRELTGPNVKPVPPNLFEYPETAATTAGKSTKRRSPRSSEG